MTGRTIWGSRTWATAWLLAGLVSAAAIGADPPPNPAATQPAAGRVTVAVLDYEGSLQGNPDLGHQISDILSVRLSVSDAFDVVERSQMGQVLGEQRAALAGLLGPEKSQQAGHLLGAQLLVMGKVLMVDRRLMIVTKVVGVQTGQLKGTIREVDMNKPISEAIQLLAEDVSEVIRKDAVRLLPKPGELVDPLDRLRKLLAGRKLPAMAVVIAEEHRSRAVFDPAAETEIKGCLAACGVPVVDTAATDLAEWAGRMMQGNRPPWPAAVAKAEDVVVGQAFSEFAARSGELISCAARVEINLVDRTTGRVLLASHATGRAVDLAEGLAAKTALTLAARKLALEILEHLAAIVPPAAPRPQAPAGGP
ncbi:MAG: hypothetical protein BIFFINMI_02801 [Phycisphaerae bacterium]|nr:hypothetical protein [Phycisphaerae bacterium]